MSGDQIDPPFSQPRVRHTMPFPPDGAVHLDGTRCPCRPAIHQGRDGVFEYIHQWMSSE